MTFDRHVRIVIIGGGADRLLASPIIWRATGERDVLLLEKAQLTHGCTWHAAGLVGQLRGKRNLTRLMQNSVAVFDRLEAETGQAIDWKKVGSLRLASSPERWREIRRSMTQAKSFGFECHSLSAQRGGGPLSLHRARRHRRRGLHPERRLCRSLFADHGLCHGRAGEAASRIEEGVRVTDIVRRRPARRPASSPTTARSAATSSSTAPASGPSASARWPAWRSPPASSSTSISSPRRRSTLPPTLTTLRDPDKNFYLKPDVGSFAIGGWEDGTKGCWRGHAAARFRPRAVPAQHGPAGAVRAARRRAAAGAERDRHPDRHQRADPGLGRRRADHGPRAGARQFLSSPAASPPASPPRAGRARRWPTGSSTAIRAWTSGRSTCAASAPLQAQGALSGGAGDRGLWRLLQDPLAGRGDAFGARPARCARSTTRLDAAGAVFGSKFGWERPNWFAPPGSERVDRPSFEGKPNWFDAVAERAPRDPRARGADRPDLVREVRDVGAGRRGLLQRIAANDVDRAAGRCIYTQLCNERGGIEADVTLMRLARRPASTSSPARASASATCGWIARHLPDGVRHRARSPRPTR